MSLGCQSPNLTLNSKLTCTTSFFLCFVIIDSRKAKEMLDEWNLTIEPNVIKLHGRKIDGPGLIFGERTTIPKAGPDFSREAGLSVYEPVRHAYLFIFKFNPL